MTLNEEKGKKTGTCLK